MEERRNTQRTRSLHAGTIVPANELPVIDCLVRDLSDAGACLQVASVVGIPTTFELRIEGELAGRPCTATWWARNRIGVEFRPAAEPGTLVERQRPIPLRSVAPAPAPLSPAGGTVHDELLALRAALNEIPVGIVLLDDELRAQFINRAFRKMWRLPDAKADSKPPFVALVYHGRDTRAYEIPEDELNSYVAERVAMVKVGHTAPVDLRLASGEVLRSQCTPLPNGGRMLSYTYVTDIVRHADELEVLRTALDNVEEGITLLDGTLAVQFMNRAARTMWKVSDQTVARKPNYAELVNGARISNPSGVPPDQLDDYIAERIAMARCGDPTPKTIPLGDGRSVRLRCAGLPNGGRMLTYGDVTDMVRDAAEMHRFATTDGLTELSNRRHFLTLADVEWQRFQRYQRPLSLLLFDIDHFKSINDRLGHDAGDQALRHLATLAREHKRSVDSLARLGGDEFVLLLPETALDQAGVTAERLCDRVACSPLWHNGTAIEITISIGVADATLSMSDIQALMKKADEALYRAKFLGRNRVSAALPSPVLAPDLAAE